MDHRGAHIVVAVVGRFVIVLLELELVLIEPTRAHEAKPRHKIMRFGNFVTRFQIRALVLEREELAAAVSSLGLDRELGGRRESARLYPDTEARRHVLLENLDRQRIAAERDAARPIAMAMAVTMIVSMPAGEQPRACDIDRKSKEGDGD